MFSDNAIGKEGSGASTTEQAATQDEEQVGVGVEAVERANACPECEAQVVKEGQEMYCVDCGLVVERDELDRSFSPGAHGPSRKAGPQEWATEPTTAFRVDRGLGTWFNLGRDGYGNGLSSAQKDRFARLRKLHKRMDKRDIRLNEALRDVESIVGNAGLPRYVGEDACGLMRRAFDERLASGRMAWESLAAGAVLLAMRRAGMGREIGEVVRYAKSTEERACAAARKIRVQCGLCGEYPPVRGDALGLVIVELEDVLDAEAMIRSVTIGRELLAMADEEPIGPGTPRVTMAGAAVYAADRLTDGKVLTQQEVADAVGEVCSTSKSKIGGYSRELFDAYESKESHVKGEVTQTLSSLSESLV